MHQEDQKNKQIEERRDLIDILYMSGYGLYWGDCNDIAKQIQEQDYRKSTDVAEEIFAEIEFEINQLDFDWGETKAIAIEGIIAELKKKYESEKDDEKNIR